MSADLERLATSCIFPGFEGPVAPDWVRRRLAEGLGGVVLYAWNVESRDQLRALTADLRAERSDVLVAIDEEGGDVTRLEADAGSSYPGNAALGVVDDTDLTERVAASLGSELADVGVNLDLAPVSDVNTNPDNPVIGIRAFGADGALVARHVAAFVRGLQRAGVAACAKHFPGHGDTSEDSHLALPVVGTLEDAALEPFRSAIEAGVQSLMTAHIVVRSASETPATMSREILHLLRGELGFDGMVMTDALEMRAISATVGVEEGAVRAIAAGADALCLGHDLFDESVVRVRDALVEAVRSRRVPEERLVEAAERVGCVAAWAASGPRVRNGVDDAARLEVARRALHVEGGGELDRAPLVVELEPDAGMAAGRLDQTPADWFGAIVSNAEIRRLGKSSIANEVDLDGRQLVVIARDAHRHAWERAAIDALIARAPDAVVVEVGLPHWRPEGAGTFVATYGAGRVNVEAAAERLYSGPRRGVEQSGSSPGS